MLRRHAGLDQAKPL